MNCYSVDTSPLPSERPETSITSEYDVSVFIDNSELDIEDMVVEHNETEDEEERRNA